MENDLHGPREGPPWLIQTGSRPVLFSAVHGVVHERPGLGIKSAEARTGGLARVLAASLDTSVAVVLRGIGEPDANFDPQHPLKLALLEQQLVGPHMAVIDLHGMTDHHAADVAIGWGPNLQLAEAVAALAVTAFADNGFRVDPNGAESGLYGAGEGTITTFAQRHGSSAIQVEIARRNRTFRSGAERRIRLLRSFCRLVDDIEQKLPGLHGTD